MVSFYFTLTLFILVCVTGFVSAFDHFSMKKQRIADGIDHTPMWIDYSRSFFPVLLLVLLLRSFVFEPFRIPSGSLEPTLLIGDLIVVNKYDYGLRLPLLNNKVLKVGHPQRGDIVVFRWPVDPNVDYIKRVIGLPGDHIEYKNKVLTINGKPAPQKFVGFTNSVNEFGQFKKVEKRTETFNSVTHNIYINPNSPPVNGTYTVPKGEYFVMGDNRDDSSDSRFWGYLPEQNLIGKATRIWMSWNRWTKSVRYQRIGKKIV